MNDRAKARKRDLDRRRGSAWKRGYDADWNKIRKAYLAQHPWCECDECQGGKLKLTVAVVVDHRISFEERPDLRLDWSNLRAMSKEHHDARTARDQGFNKGKRVRHRGCSADGTPSDPRHPWNRRMR